MQSLRLTCLGAIVALALIPAVAHAQSGGFSGTSGVSATGTPAPSSAPVYGSAPSGEPPAVTTPTALPPLGAPATTGANGAPLSTANIAATLPGAPPAKTTDTVKTDPCSAYMSSYNAYVTCQDRMQKIDRMKAASTRREDSFKAAPVVAAPATSAPTANGKPAASNVPTSAQQSVPLNASLNAGGAGGSGSATATTIGAATTTK